MSKHSNVDNNNHINFKKTHNNCLFSKIIYLLSKPLPSNKFNNLKHNFYLLLNKNYLYNNNSYQKPNKLKILINQIIN